MNASQATANAAAAAELIGALVAHGLRRVLICPGSRNTPLVLAADAENALEVEVLHDERVAAFYALGLAREDGFASAMITTSGSAIAHALPAAIEAAASDVPLLLISADRPTELHDCAAPQTTQQSQVLSSHVRLQLDLGAQAPQQETTWLATAAARAWSAAHGPAPGPVHINIAFREPLWTPEVRASAAARPRRTLSGRVQLGGDQLDELADALDQQRTVIVCGPLTGADRPRALGAALTRLASHRGWPLIADMATGLRHQELSAPVIAAGDIIARCDAAPLLESLAPKQVLCFGLPPTSKALGQRLEGWRAKVIAFESAGRTRDPHHMTSLFVAADPGGVVEGLLERLDRDPPSDFTRAWLAADEIVARSLEQQCAQGLWGAPVVRALLQAFPAGSLLHLASSLPIRDAESFGGRSAKQLRFAVSRGVNGIDGTLSTFAGEARSHGGEAALLIGDTALLHDLSGLFSAARRARPLTIVVLNNGGGGIFSHLPIAAHGAAFERYFHAPHDANIEQICRGAGIEYHPVRTRDALTPAIEAARAQRAVSLVEISLDRGDDLNRHQRAWAHAAEALRQNITGANA